MSDTDDDFSDSDNGFQDIPAPEPEAEPPNGVAELTDGNPKDIDMKRLTVNGLMRAEFIAPAGCATLVLPAFQRPYEWTSSMAQNLLLDLLKKHHDNISMHILGTITVWKEDTDSREVCLLDGQQRVLTVYLIMAVLRYYHAKNTETFQQQPGGLQVHIDDGQLFVYRDVKQSMTELLPRVKLRKHQQEFWKTYICCKDPMRLSGLWKENGDPDYSLAGGDQVLHGMIETLDMIRATLQNPPPDKNGTAISYIDCNAASLDKLLAFAMFLFERIEMGVAKITGGGGGYCTQMFINVNKQQKPLNEQDMLKAFLVQEVSMDDRESYSTAWETAYFNLRGHSISCLNDRSAFVQALYVVMELRLRSKVAVPVPPNFSLLSYYVPARDSGSIIKGIPKEQSRLPICSEPAKFMEYFNPVSFALDLIFNWEKITIPPDILKSEHKRLAGHYIDRIQTICSCLVEVLKVRSSNNKFRPAMATWIPVAVVFFHHLYKDFDPDLYKDDEESYMDIYTTQLSDLADKLQLLYVRMFYFVLNPKLGSSAINFMLGGGKFTNNDKKVSVKGLLNHCCPDGEPIETSEGKKKRRVFFGTLKEPEWQVIASYMKLTEAETESLLKSLLHLDYDTRGGNDRLILRTMLTMHDHESRHNSDEAPYQYELQNSITRFNYSKQLIQAKTECQLDHILPQKNNAHNWRSWWSAQELIVDWLPMIGNLALMEAQHNRMMRNKDYRNRKQSVTGNNHYVVFRSTKELYQRNGQWTVQECSKRDKEIFLDVARFLKIDEGTAEQLYNAEVMPHSQTLRSNPSSTVQPNNNESQSARKRKK